MGFGCMIYVAMKLLAMARVFIFIPLVSEWPFWIVVAAYSILGGSRGWW